MSKTESEQQRVVNVSKRGQATIPKEFRDELGIEAPGRVKFVRTEEGDIVVKPIQSLTDLRGILSGKTDEDGKTATEILRDERERDKQKDREMMDRLNIETDEGNGE
jgi:antitoxin PrlF